MNKAVFSMVAAACLPVLAFGAIDGIVRNETTGAPQPGATVSLFRVSQEGPQMLESVKSDASGKFTIAQEVQGGPRLLQAAYKGVTYNKMLPPGFPSDNVVIQVYESSNKPGASTVQQHMMLLEPSANGMLSVSESFVLKNDSKVTFNDPDKGTLQFALPPEAQGKVEINVVAPNSVPLRRAADPAGKPNTFKLDFPVKPGESRVDLQWSMPFNTPGVFENRVLYKGGSETRIVAPKGVSIKGDGVQDLGEEPRTQATIYGVKGPEFRVRVEGTGSLRQPDAAAADAPESDAPKLTENLPKLYGMISSTTGLGGSILSVKWILLTVGGMLALGFVLLYRKGNPTAMLPAKAGDARGRR